jgi:hypothetical protein
MAVAADVTRLDMFSEMVDDSDIGKIIELLSQMVCWQCFVRTRFVLSLLTHEQGAQTNHRRVTVTRRLNLTLSFW